MMKARITIIKASTGCRTRLFSEQPTLEVEIHVPRNSWAVSSLSERDQHQTMLENALGSQAAGSIGNQIYWHRTDTGQTVLYQIDYAR